MPAPDPITHPALHRLYLAAKALTFARLQRDRAGRQADALAAIADAHRLHHEQQQQQQPRAGDGTLPR